MTCKECKFGELTKDIFTGKYFYLCTNECEIPFGGFGDTEIPSSKTVLDCPFGEKIEGVKKGDCPSINSKVVNNHPNKTPKGLIKL